MLCVLIEREYNEVVSLRRSSIREAQVVRFAYLPSFLKKTRHRSWMGKFGPGMEGWERSDQDFAEQKTKR